MKDDIKLIPLRKDLKGNMNYESYVNQDVGVIYFSHKYMNQSQKKKKKNIKFLHLIIMTICHIIILRHLY